MVVIIVCGLVAAFALPFMARLALGQAATRRASHFLLYPAAGIDETDPDRAGAAMRAATSSLQARAIGSPLVVIHRYRRDGAVCAGLSVMARHPERIAALVAGAAGTRVEPVDRLDLPSPQVLRYGQCVHSQAEPSKNPMTLFAGWVDGVLAGAAEDAVLSIGVTPATRWQRARLGDEPGLLRGRVVAAAGDRVTAATLAAGCGSQLPQTPTALTARRPGDGPIVAWAAVLAVTAGSVVGAGPLFHERFGAAFAAVRSGTLAAVAVAATASLRLVHITEGCWRHWQRLGVVLPERPGRRSLRSRHHPAGRTTVPFSPAQLAALCSTGRSGER